MAAAYSELIRNGIELAQLYPCNGRRTWEHAEAQQAAILNDASTKGLC